MNALDGGAVGGADPNEAGDAKPKPRKTDVTHGEAKDWVKNAEQTAVEDAVGNLNLVAAKAAIDVAANEPAITADVEQEHAAHDDKATVNESWTLCWHEKVGTTVDLF